MTGPDQSQSSSLGGCAAGFCCESVAFDHLLSEYPSLRQEHVLKKTELQTCTKGSGHEPNPGILVVESLLGFAEKWQKKTC